MMTERDDRLALAEYVEYEQSCGVDIKLGDTQADMIVAALRCAPAPTATVAQDVIDRIQALKVEGSDDPCICAHNNALTEAIGVLTAVATVAGVREALEAAYNVLVFYANMDSYNTKSHRIEDAADGSPRYRSEPLAVLDDDGQGARSVLPILRAALSATVEPGREEIARAMVDNLVPSLDVNGKPIINGINTATSAILALLPPRDGQAEPVAWADSQGLERPIDAEAMKLLRQNPTTESYWSRFNIPLYANPMEWEGRAHRAEAALRFARAKLLDVPGTENMVAWIDDVEQQAWHAHPPADRADVAGEREACAKEAEQWGVSEILNGELTDDQLNQLLNSIGPNIAAAIRARITTPGASDAE